MDFPLLTTRTHAPPPARHAIARPRLVELLERELPAYRLTLVSAPAGYGKTTLLAEWARASRFPVAWLSAERDDDQRDRLFRAMLAAWEQVDPDVLHSPLGLLLGGPEPDADAVVAAFIALVTQRRDHLIFVIDDVHELADPAIWQALTRLIDHLPPLAHLVLAGRGEPPLPIGRYRARQELLELGMDDVQLSRDEAGLLLRRMLSREPAVEELDALHTRLEGWPAGWQLAGLSLQHGTRGPEPMLVDGRHHFIADYLREDVLAPLPPEISRFLIQTSILDRFCASLCDAVTGESGSRELLDRLERAGLFLIPLDDDRSWFRYHGLFADVLRDELSRYPADQIEELQRRAARWHHEHHLPEQALRHAVAGDDAELAAQIAEGLFEIKLLGCDYGSLGRWLDALPTTWQQQYPMLGLFRAGLLLSTGAIDAGIRQIDWVEQELQRSPHVRRDLGQARVVALRCLVACFMNDLQVAKRYAVPALAELSPEDHMLRSAIHHALGDSYRRQGYWSEARSHYLQALELTHEPAYHVRSVHVLGALADLALEQGLLRQSALYWKRALALIETRATWGALPLPVTGWIFIRYAGLLYEWNKLDEARRHLAQGIERAELGGDVRAIIAGSLVRARLNLAAGQIDQAAEDLEQARPLLEETAFPETSAWFERCRLALALARSTVSVAPDRAGATLDPAASPITSDAADAGLVNARALIVQGDLPVRQQARSGLDEIREQAEAAGQLGATIEAMALQAIAHERDGDQVSALVSLERALRFAEPDGYVRLFVDLGPHMARLLQAARSRGVMTGYVDRLLAAFADLPAARGERALPEPLSDRETEVLRLIAAGLTNREIAGTLVISAETVKKHTSSIYGKLGVRGRTEAAARGRTLGLLG